MATLEFISTPVFAIRAGDYIHHGIICRVTAVHPLAYAGDEDNPYEVSIHVEDGNGERYFFRSQGGTLGKVNMTAEEWDAYRAS